MIWETFDTNKHDSLTSRHQTSKPSSFFPSADTRCDTLRSLPFQLGLLLRLNSSPPSLPPRSVRTSPAIISQVARRERIMGFGDFQTICHKAALPVCSVVGPKSLISGNAAGIQANCYARSVSLANTIIFEAATDFMHILALGMAAIMVFHVRSKFTAVGTGRFLPPYIDLCSDASILQK